MKPIQLRSNFIEVDFKDEMCIRDSLESAQKSNLSTEELQKQLEKAVNDAKERETQFNADLASMQKTNAVKLALKDSGNVNSDLLFGQVKMDNVIIQDDGKI